LNENSFVDQIKYTSNNVYRETLEESGGSLPEKSGFSVATTTEGKENPVSVSTKTGISTSDTTWGEQSSYPSKTNSRSEQQMFLKTA
jgi:hypothetical protein